MSSVLNNSLECPVGSYPEPTALLQDAIRWHFSEETGSKFWLDRKAALGFDPVEEIQNFTDLTKFPNLIDDLRDVPVEDLVPRGIPASEVYGIYESGGTTGVPKRVVCTRTWIKRWVAFSEQGFRNRGHEPGGNWLSVMPTGPHIFGAAIKEQAENAGGVVFTIDMDPRWVKKRIAAGDVDGAGAYADHLLEQMTHLLQTQHVTFMVITPPLLIKAASNAQLVSLINDKVRYIQWGGAHMDSDTRHLFRTEIFPQVTLQGGYGSTMVLGGSMERPDLPADGPCIFDPMGPYISFNVIDPATGAPVAYGERGQVVMNLVSKGMFLPNNPERDTALRFPSLGSQPGDAVADVGPLQSFGGTEVIEGVY